MIVKRSAVELAARELRNRLLVVLEYPRRLPEVVALIQSDKTRWLPVLSGLATGGEPRVQAVAVKVLTTLASASLSLPDVIELLATLPRKSSAVAELAADLTARLIEGLPEKLRTSDLEAAKLWNNLSERSQDANRPEEALQCARRAVEVSQAVADDALGVGTVRVTALLTLSKRWSERSDTRQALEAAAAASDLASALASRSGTYADRWLKAQAALMHANRLAQAGDEELALKAARNAQGGFPQAPDDDAGRYDLALMHQCLANQFTESGHHEQALPHAAEADRLFRILNGTNPDQYQEYSAAAAYTYAVNLTQTGDLRRAYELSRYAVERMRALHRRQPLRFGAECVAYQLGHSQCAADLGYFPEALKMGLGAVRAVRAHGRRAGRRDWFLEAKTLSSLFLVQYRLQMFRPALVSIRAAVRALDQLDDARPQVAMEQIRSRRNLAEAQRLAGGLHSAQKAVATARESILRLQDYPGQRTPAVLMLESQCRITLAQCLEEAGEPEKALQQDAVALDIRRGLFAQSAGVHRVDLAYSLQQSARRCLQAGSIEKAAALADESVRLFETVTEEVEESTPAFFAEALRTLADAQSLSGDNQAAIANLTRAIRLLRPRYASAPEIWQASLLPICVRYVQTCEIAGIEFDATLVSDVIERARRQP